MAQAHDVVLSMYTKLQAHVAPDALPTGAWDLTTLLQNAQEQIKVWGGGLLILLGVVGLIWGGVLATKKLMASQQSSSQQAGWGQIALLIMVGGALSTGGWSLVSKLGSGGQKTVEDLGNSAITFDSLATFTNFVASGGLFG